MSIREQIHTSTSASIIREVKMKNKLCELRNVIRMKVCDAGVFVVIPALVLAPRIVAVDAYTPPQTSQLHSSVRVICCMLHLFYVLHRGLRESGD